MNTSIVTFSKTRRSTYQASYWKNDLWYIVSLYVPPNRVKERNISFYISDDNMLNIPIKNMMCLKEEELFQYEVGWDNSMNFHLVYQIQKYFLIHYIEMDDYTNDKVILGY